MNNINRNRVYELYMSGLSIANIRNIFSCDYYVIKSIIESFPELKNLRNVRRKDIPNQEVINKYIDGMSELSISNFYNCSRSVIRNILVKNNVSIRNGSQANFIRFSNCDSEYLSNITKKANESIRNKPRFFHINSSIKQAQTKEKTKSKIGKFEEYFINEFINKGYKITSQKAFHVYNIDIAVGNIAVEIHINPSHPHNHLFYKKRIEYLTNRGWNVIYVKIGNQGLNATCINNVCEIINLLSLNPSIRSQYWMIRGASECVTIGKFDFDKNSLVFTSKDIFNISDINFS